MKLALPPLHLSKARTPEGVEFLFLASQIVAVWRRDPGAWEWQAVPYIAYRPEQLPAKTEVEAVTL